MMALICYHDGMIRMQIQVEEETARFLKRRAAERGVSIAALVREAVDRMIAEPQAGTTRDRALALAGKFRSGTRDLAQRHDDYLAEDFAR